MTVNCIPSAYPAEKLLAPAGEAPRCTVNVCSRRFKSGKQNFGLTRFLALARGLLPQNKMPPVS